MANTMTEAQKEFGKAKPPNWVSVELKAVKMAAHEASTGDGMIGRGSLTFFRFDRSDSIFN